jgi:hypothetical protein
VTVAGAGIADAYDEPSSTLGDLAGVHDSPRDRIAVESETTMNPFAPRSTPFIPNATGSCTLAKGEAPLPFTAQAVSKLTPTTTGAAAAAIVPVANLATYSDGSAAITLKSAGKGRMIHFGFLPGLSYWFSQKPGLGNRQRDENLRTYVIYFPHSNRPSAMGPSLLLVDSLALFCALV